MSYWAESDARRQASRDFERRGRPDRDMNDRHGSDAQRAYAKEFDHCNRDEERKQEDRREEERADQRREENRKQEQAAEWRRQESLENEERRQTEDQEVEADVEKS